MRRCATTLRRGDFNPRAPCGARPLRCSRAMRTQRISIHVPLAGHDAARGKAGQTCAISIHVPLAGHDDGCDADQGRSAISIHVPLAGHDTVGEIVFPDEPDFNPRAPCGARRCRAANHPRRHVISIHVPLAGHDGHACGNAHRARAISIHVPLAGHDAFEEMHQATAQISIHVPLAGHDRVRWPLAEANHNFNPRAPCGARHTSGRAKPCRFLFQSTCPLRGTTRMQAG